MLYNYGKKWNNIVGHFQVTVTGGIMESRGSQGIVTTVASECDYSISPFLTFPRGSSC